MNWIDKLFGPKLEGQKTEYLALAASLVGVIVIVANMFFGIELGENVVSILENAVAIGLALTLGARLTRTSEAVKKVEMNQPAGKPIVIPADIPNFKEGDQV